MLSAPHLSMNDQESSTRPGDFPSPIEALQQNIAAGGTPFLDSFEVDFQPVAPRTDLKTDPIYLTRDKGNNSTNAAQRLMWTDKEAVKETVISKLYQAHRMDLAKPLCQCHTEVFRRQCTGCHSVSTYWNRCENFYCPMCQPRLANDKRESVEWWTKTVKNPRHVVLTCRNTETITKEQIQGYKAAFTKLRRSKLCSNWIGGFYSIETTNEGRGWHVHFHVLVESGWIDQRALSVKWGQLVGQDYAIVWVKYAGQVDYLRELVKYAVDGNTIAQWKPADLVAFITAFKGVRTFGVFGSLYAKRSEFKAFLESVQADKDVCACGCNTFRTFSQGEWEWQQIKVRPGPTSSAANC